MCNAEGQLCVWDHELYILLLYKLPVAIHAQEREGGGGEEGGCYH